MKRVSIGVILLYLMPLSLVAESESVFIPQVSGSSGSTIFVAVEMSQRNRYCSGFNASLQLPPQLAPRRVIKGELIQNDAFKLEYEIQNQEVIVLAYSPDSCFSGPGTVVYIEAQVDPDAGEGAYPLSFLESWNEHIRIPSLAYADSENGIAADSANGLLIVDNSSNSNPFNNWLTTYFSEAVIAGFTDPFLADPDQDQLSNLLEYLFGGNPGIADRECIPLVSGITDSAYTLTCRLRSDNPDLEYAIEVSGNFSGWTPTELQFQGNQWTTHADQPDVINSTELEPGLWRITILVPLDGNGEFARITCNFNH